MPQPKRDEFDIFYAALQHLAAAERAAFVDAACAGDAELRQRVAELLRAHDRAGELIARAAKNRSTQPPTSFDAQPSLPAADAHSLAAFSNTSLELPGARIGRYKLIERLGEGGFGVVYLAEQIEPVVRRIALKIIKLGMDTREVIARFESERQTLALMDHPGIARALDAGATAAGRPYFVMELVCGVRITEYCDQHRLDVRERLGLMIQVCQAVQHAHQKGIIHRDIKPSNVLVTSSDGKPLLKVIDFGLAKAMIPQREEHTPFTRIHQLVGTPAYMSPEQADGSNVDVDIRSDVYSLGVLLYETLVGDTPFDSRRLCAASNAELQRIIREEEAPRPSSRLESAQRSASPGMWGGSRESSVGESPSSIVEIARRRRTNPRTLTRRLRGDLDWIVMKCLEKDRSRRYETANALALDLQRFLNDEPIAAGPPSRMYRLKKLVRRNKAVVGGIVATFLALTLGLVGTSVSLRRALLAEERERFERQLAQENEALANRRAEETQKAAAFHSQMLREIDADAMGRGIKECFRERVRASLERQWIGEFPERRPRSTEEIEAELAHFDALTISAESVDVARRVMDEFVLKRALDALEPQFSEQPLVQARILDTIGMIYQSLGLYEDAESPARRALELRRAEHGDGHLDVVDSLNNLGFILHHKGKFAEAEPFYREALALQRSRSGDEHEGVALSLNNLGLLLRDTGRSAEAESCFREALALRRASPGTEPSALILSLNNCGLSRFDAGDLGAAEAFFREAMAIPHESTAKNNAALATAVNNLAGVLHTRGDLAAVEPLLRDSLALFVKLRGEEHPDVALSLSNLAMVLHYKGEFDAAESLCRQALALRRRLLGDEHPFVAASLNNLGGLLQAKNDYDAAEPVFREALALRRKALGDDHADVALALNNLSLLLVAKGDVAAAEPPAREAVAILKKQPSPNSSRLAIFQANLGDLLTKRAAEIHNASATEREAPLKECGPLLHEAEELLTRAWMSLGENLNVPSTYKQRVLTASIELYEVWSVSEPGQGHDAKAAEWRSKFDDWRPTTQPVEPGPAQ